MRACSTCAAGRRHDFALRRRANNGRPQIIGADFSHAMLQRATIKEKGLN